MTDGITTAVTFGGAPYDPDEMVAWTAANEHLVQTTEPAEPLWQEIERPTLDTSSLDRELGARCLLGVSTDAPPPMLINRLDPEGHTILFGDGGSGKGTMAAWWTVELARQGKRVLIVDYENHPTEWARRIYGLGGDEALERAIHVAPLAPAWTLERGPIWEQARVPPRRNAGRLAGRTPVAASRWHLGDLRIRHDGARPGRPQAPRVDGSR